MADAIPHTQALMVISLLEKGLPRTRGGQIPLITPVSACTRKQAKRFAGGLIRGTGDARLDASTRLRRVFVATVTKGAQLQQTAQALTRDAETLIREEATKLRSVHKLALRWRTTTCEAGPTRVAALKEVHMARDLVTQEIARRAERGQVDVDIATRQLDELVTSGDKDAIRADTVVGGAIAAVRREHVLS